MQAATWRANLGNRTRPELALMSHLRCQQQPELRPHGELILPLASISLCWDSCCHHWDVPSTELVHIKYCYSTLLFAAWAFPLSGHGCAATISAEFTNMKMLNSQKKVSIPALILSLVTFSIYSFHISNNFFWVSALVHLHGGLKIIRLRVFLVHGSLSTIVNVCSQLLLY